MTNHDSEGNVSAGAYRHRKFGSEVLAVRAGDDTFDLAQIMARESNVQMAKIGPRTWRAATICGAVLYIVHGDWLVFDEFDGIEVLDDHQFNQRYVFEDSIGDGAPDTESDLQKPQSAELMRLPEFLTPPDDITSQLARIEAKMDLLTAALRVKP